MIRQEDKVIKDSKESHSVQGIRNWNYKDMKEVQDAEAGV